MATVASDSSVALAALDRLAHDAGLTTSYTDGLGVSRRASAESVLAVLRALGHPVQTPDDAANELDELSRIRAERWLPPTLVSFDRERVPLVVPGSVRDRPIALCVTSPDGSQVEWTHGPASAGPVVSIDVPEALADGVHRLDVATAMGSESCWLIVAPRRCHGGPIAAGRASGVFLPLYAAHTARSWGMGDLGDLTALGQWATRHGAGVVGTLPLLAAFSAEPFEASPYLPVSRRFWNEAYLDVDALVAPWWSAAALELAERHRGALRADRGPLVGVERVVRAKRQVIEAAFVDGDPPPATMADIERFVAGRPEAARYAAFRALGETTGADWRRWPAASPEPSAAVDRARRYHLVAQYLCDRQLGGVRDAYRAAGASLYLDLPLGSHPDGYDRWADPEQFVDGMSLGAPPDAFFPTGQTWGLPPRAPSAGHVDGYASLAADLDHHLSVAGLLRIDHVMSLHRCFWVPDGAGASDGVYVRYPGAELMAVLAAASHRHRATLVGEDLGTVPDEVRMLLDRHGMIGMYVALFAATGDARRPLARPRPDCVASLSTHDLPTFPGWWTGHDIDDRLDLGLIDEAAAAATVEHRRAERRGLAQAAGRDADDTTTHAALAAQRVALAELASSDAALVLVDIEGLWGETLPQNVPGTVEERSNWRRRARHGLDELDDRADVVEGLAAATMRARIDPVEQRLVSDVDMHLFHEGRHFDLHERLGARVVKVGDRRAVSFAVWAPDAERVSVVGSFNDWDGGRHPLTRVPSSGMWAGVIDAARVGDTYKYRVWSRHRGYRVDKADPVAAYAEVAPASASVVWEASHVWGDQEWMASRSSRQGAGRPMSITEIHLGSWRRDPARSDELLGYRALAPLLTAHCRDMGFTHVELMPVMEHPYYASWGYQVTGFFAPSSRWGTPDDFAYLVDHLHQNGIGVICDWVPSHFPSDEHGLGFFDGTYLYEHADVRQRIHPEWQSLQFNYGRHEVRSFLVSSAMCWLDRFHIDGLRVDAVASMLYLDYGRNDGEWAPNQFGGREDLDAVRFLQELNTAVYARHPDVVMIAEESTSWPGVTHPVHEGGLGFGFKWDMGWMHDSLDYMRRETVHRRWHHHDLTFRTMYQSSEHFVLPLSHDEVVHGKRSLLGRMPGDDWQRFANLRLLLAWQHTSPGVPLLFMGEEMAPADEWNHDRSLHWHLLDHAPHAGVRRWVAHLNHIRPQTPALYELDRDPAGFRWVDADDAGRSLFSFVRTARDGRDTALVVLNATPSPRAGVTLGVPGHATWQLVANSDATEFGGSGHRTAESVASSATPSHGFESSITLTVPPLAALILRRSRS